MATSTGAPDGRNPEYNRAGAFKRVAPNVKAATKKVAAAGEYGYNKVVAKILKNKTGTTRDYQGDGTF